MVRISAGTKADWKDGQMKEFPLDSSDPKSAKVLVSQVKGQIYATSSKCTHFGAPLAKGVLSNVDGCVTCPWHGARFNVCSGDIEDAPGLSSLHSFKVVVEGDKVFVEGEEAAVKASGRGAKGCKGAKGDKGIVILGGGSAAGHFVDEIRDAGWTGKVTVVSSEPHLPIDRTKLSKALITDPAKIALRDADFYKDADVTIMTSTTATAVSLSSSTVELSTGSKLSYSHLILAPGSVARSLPIDGADLKGVLSLRNIQDTKAIDAVLGTEEKKSRVVIVGSSFIGMELAVAAAKRAEISVIGMENAPFENVLGQEIGNGIRKFHEKNGVKFYMAAGVDKFVPSESDPSKVGAVLLKSGELLACDAVVLGVGARPATDFLKSSGFTLEKDGSVLVDEFLKVKDVQGEVYAVGDIAKYPDGLNGGKPTRIEHWNVAGSHARMVARAISSGTPKPYLVPPVFWSAQGQQLRYVGSALASSWTDVHIDGTPDDLKFVAYYYSKESAGKVVAVASMQGDPIVVQAAELFRQGKFPTIDEIKAGKDVLSIQI